MSLIGLPEKVEATHKNHQFKLVTLGAFLGCIFSLADPQNAKVFKA